jgi:hypothetical protein
MRQVNLDLPSKTEEDSRTSVAYSQEAGSPHKEIGQLLLHYENATNKSTPLVERGKMTVSQALAIPIVCGACRSELVVPGASRSSIAKAVKILEVSES